MKIVGLIPESRVIGLRQQLKRRRRKVVFTNGVFDLLHRGHIDYLATAKSFGDVLVVGLNSDASVRRLKGQGRPIQNQRDRAAILLALESVDFVTFFGEPTPENLIQRLRPDVLVKGADYRLSEIVGAEFVKSYGGTVRRIRLSKGRSTSGLLARLRRL